MLEVMRMLYREARALPVYLPARARGAEGGRFVVLAQSRSGTRLLQTLLNCHPAVECETTLFDRQLPKLLQPDSYIRKRAGRSDAPCFGFLIHPTHIARLNDLVADTWLARLHDEGWRLIHLRRRNLLRQAISWEIARLTDVWHVREGSYHSASFTFDPEDVVRRTKLRELDRERERLYLAGRPHAKVVYERDLLPPEARQPALNRLFDYLGLTAHPVATTLVRTGQNDLRAVLANYDAVAAAVSEAGLGHYLE